MPVDPHLIPSLMELLEDPVYFSEHILDFHPFGYQQKLLRDESKRICACMGRQTGKSLTTSAKAIHFAITNPNTTTLIVSATLRQSMLMFDKILGFVETSKAMRGSVAYRSRTRIRFRNGSWIIALPCGRAGNNLRGHSASLIVADESAFIPEEVITNVVLPMISTTNGSVWMLSTPYDREHIFYRAFNDPAWSVYHLPSSVNPLISKDFLEEQRRMVGELNYLQEYKAQFVDDVNAYFPMTLIRQCIDPDLSEDYKIEPLENGYGGYDPGGKVSRAGFTAVSKDKNEYEIRYTKTWLHQEYTTTDAEVVDLSKSLNLEKLGVDITGLGNPLVEHLNEIYEQERVNGLTLSHKTREQILLKLRMKFEQKLIRIPNNKELLASLNCITYRRGRDGSFYFDHRRGTYDDLAYSTAISMWIADQDEGGVVIQV